MREPGCPLCIFFHEYTTAANTIQPMNQTPLHTSPTAPQRTYWQRAQPIVRQTLGWLCIVLGLLGLVLPFLQGVLFLVIGIALVGRRNTLIRWTSVRYKQLIRRAATHESPIIGWPGRLALRAQQHTSRQRRRLHWWYEARRARNMPREVAGYPEH